VSAQTCFPHPRRADARRSCERAFVHRKNRFFAEGRSHCSTRAGGVSPPWGLLTRMQQPLAHTLSAVRRTGALVSAQTCLPHPLRADARRSLRSSVADRGLIFTAQGRFHTPRWADARRAGRKRSQLQLRYSHPRRADARRSCGRAFLHRKNRFFAEGRSHCSTRAGGVSPPWYRCTRWRRRSARILLVVF
jgi:hypothetical protein